MTWRRALLLVPAASAAITMHSATGAETPTWDAAAETAVVYNSALPESVELAHYYAERRGIPADRLIGIRCSADEAISREAFNETIAPSMRHAFIERDWFKVQTQTVRNTVTGKEEKLPVVVKSHVKVLAIMRGVPLKIIRQSEHPKPSQEDEASVDAELVCLGLPVFRLAGIVINPFFDLQERFPAAPAVNGMLMVGRVDGPSQEIAKRLIDDAIAVENTGLRGRGVLDLALKTGTYEQGDDWLRRSAEIWKRTGIPAWIDTTENLIREGWPLPDTALYFGWYAGEISGALKTPEFRFKQGAIACHLHSFSASTVRSRTQAWAGPLLDRGAAAVLGNVWEPYLSLTVHFDVLNDRLTRGWTLAESAWCATPGLSWMNLVLGDPLYRPFARTAIDDGPDNDYAIFVDAAKRHAGEKDAIALKKEVTQLAEIKGNPRLLELLALRCAQESQIAEATALLEHARSLFIQPEDKVRTILYQAELLRRRKPPNGQLEAAALIKQAMQDKKLMSAHAADLLQALARELPGT